MIIDRLKRHLKERREMRRLIDMAEHHFSMAYPQRKLLGHGYVFHKEADSVVVGLSERWGGVPPRRSWWLVSRDGSCRELAFEEANAYRPIKPIR